MAELLTLDGVVVVAVPAEFALYPFGVFTTFVAVDGTILGWSKHLARLTRDVRELWGHELDRGRVGAEVAAHLARLSGPATVRVTLYPEELGIVAPAAARGCRALVSSDPVEFPARPSSAFRVCTVEHVRDHADLKSTALLGQMRLRRDAQLAGYDDVLFRRGSDVLEGATWTVLVWKDGEIATPADDVLASITAEHIGELMAGRGWRFRKRAVTLTELLRADLVTAVNVNHPARAVTGVDGAALAVDHELLATLAASYAALPREAMKSRA